MKQCKSRTEGCTCSKSKIVIEGTFTSLVMAAKESSSTLLNRSHQPTFILHLQLTHPTSNSNFQLPQSNLALYVLHKSYSTTSTSTAFSSSIAKMVKWTEENKQQLLLAIIEHLNPTSLPWEKLSNAMGPDFSNEAVR